jgi:hypothetical protein
MMSIFFLKSGMSTGYFLNLIGSYVTSSWFSLFIDGGITRFMIFWVIYTICKGPKHAKLEA